MRDNCSQCSRPIPVNRNSCVYCGGQPVKVAAADQPMPCPRCSSLMRPVLEHDVKLDRCGQCGGTWYDRGELEAIRQASGKLDDELAAAGKEEREEAARDGGEPMQALAEGKALYLPCPRCQGAMTRQNYMRASGVMMDVCGNHGLFLDAGELERIQRFHATGGVAEAQIRAGQEADDAKFRKEKDRSYINRLSSYAARRTWSGRHFHF